MMSAKACVSQWLRQLREIDGGEHATSHRQTNLHGVNRERFHQDSIPMLASAAIIASRGTGNGIQVFTSPQYEYARTNSGLS
mmetsp:Transcript_15199/g.42016  ORF Transcript_15199/g.42016 Transcript_15199/m.42016 type:complete len:82 (+) Transcript_15199:144-389(+)